MMNETNVLPFRKAVTKQAKLVKLDSRFPLQSVIEHAQQACEAGRESIINQDEWGFLIMDGTAWMFNIRGLYAVKVHEGGKPIKVNAKGFRPTHMVSFSAEYYQDMKTARVLPMTINVVFESLKGERFEYQVPETSIRGVLATLVTITGKPLELIE